MKRAMYLFVVVAAVITSLLLSLTSSEAASKDKITILYDSYGKQPTKLKMGWGFAALVEVGGKRILFDTGARPEIFEHNVKTLRVDLKHLDCVVISHRHGDHTLGPKYLKKVNPHVKIYAPFDEFFGEETNRLYFKRTVTTLPTEMRYYGGNPPEHVTQGTALPYDNIIQIKETTEIMPGFFIVPSEAPMGNEIALSIKTTKGLLVITGCGHPGIENILKAATVGDNKHVYFVIGGLHWVRTPENEIQKIVTSLHDNWKIDWVASGHCTGEPGFAALKKTFGDRYLYSGLGTVVEIP
jgi:7,8-dihydropterin-6-yl-methyl-4-(beta-D-ribofuranosyl)aminobenzene 5'-phosphate synthase